MKSINVCGVGNGIVDIFLEVSEEDFAKLGIEKGTMHLVTPEEQQELLASFHGVGLSSGGSAANSIIALSQLGGTGSFCCCLGNDEYGKHYKQEFEELQIKILSPLIEGGATGTSVILVTPDAERTMRTSLGIANSFEDGQIKEELIASAEWLFIEGYLLANPEGSGKALHTAVEYAKKHGTKIAFTCSEAWVVQSFESELRGIVSDCDLVFCNETEAKALAGTDDTKKALEVLSGYKCNTVVTLGGQGAYVSYDSFQGHIPAFSCSPVDVTGAGDMFAGSFLYGITHGYSPEFSAKGACFLASKVISQVGARMNADLQALWKEANSTDGADLMDDRQLATS